MGSLFSVIERLESNPPPPGRQRQGGELEEHLERLALQPAQPLTHDALLAHNQTHKALPHLNRLSVQRLGSKETASEAVIHKEVFSEGNFKLVFRGQYIAGRRAGEPCVAKTFKPSHGSFQQQLRGELRVIRMAKSIVDAWNEAKVIGPPIHLLIPELMASRDGRGGHHLVEPVICGYQKHNNNTGWVNPSQDPWNEVMQALSHFSYHHSGGGRLLCDIQGGVGYLSYVITDPVIQSITFCQFGTTDLGQKGILKFFESHRCNGFCLPHWTWPEEVARPPAPGWRLWRAPNRR